MNEKITTQWLRQKWLEFFAAKNHAIIPSASVLPENDPSALFHNSGMHPLVPYLEGEIHPSGTRLANAQKCIRTGDIAEVGDATHLTFFEMLGNWSLGDFFKNEQIEWSFEFLTKVLNLPVEKLAVSVFEGDANCPRDEESAEIWQRVGMPSEKIAFLPASENWWAKGETGPCGPDTEMFFWTGDSPAPANFQESWQNPNWVEIWNDVFMQFGKNPDGSLQNLPKKNVDTGMGLERTVAILNGKTSVFETDAFAPILNKIAEISGRSEVREDPTADSKIGRAGRIVADHLRASAVILADGVVPGNLDAGYILRRLIRRAVRCGRTLGVFQNLCAPVADAAIGSLADHYPELAANRKSILAALEQEESLFRKTLEKGEKEFEKLAAKSEKISGEAAFDLFQTFGFPLEMTAELAAEKGTEIDEAGFEKAFQAHQSISKKGAEKKFAGGLADHSQKTTALHTATHLLLAALREVLGSSVHQRGANITPERARFDFSHSEKMTPEQIAAVEDFVNAAIAADAEKVLEEVSKKDAESDPTIEGSFWEKYPETVKVFTFRDASGKVWSRELCGGPHADRTGNLGVFRIKKEQSSSAGVRRIKAVLE